MKRSLLFFSIVIAIGFWFCKSKKQTVKSVAEPETVMSPPPLETAEGLNLGNRAPEIIMKNPKDSVIQLSSLRGKIVLVDFWASWCAPCRQENPYVVATYDKYKNAKLKNAKGFAIYSVSLDNNKQKWEKAISSDNLSWAWHVSDLAGWGNQAAAKYGVQGIPTNYLLDANGIIIGKALRGEDLDRALEKLLVK